MNLTNTQQAHIRRECRKIIGEPAKVQLGLRGEGQTPNVDNWPLGADLGEFSELGDAEIDDNAGDAHLDLYIYDSERDYYGRFTGQRGELRDHAGVCIRGGLIHRVDQAHCVEHYPAHYGPKPEPEVRL